MISGRFASCSLRLSSGSASFLNAAQRFITPLTFAALTGRKVITNLFSTESSEETLSSAIEHIAVAQDADAMVIAPATADLLARLAHGHANDFLTTTYLAFTGPVVLAPAMNSNMWAHPATQENVAILRKRGHRIVEPEEGILACGTTGPGRLAEPDRIADVVANLGITSKDLEGETVLITAGPTQEPLDPVRFISNRSSGKMGYALAEAATQRGAHVILISGPVHLPAPSGVTLIRVRTAVEMRNAVFRRRLMARAGPDIGAEGDRLHAIHPLGQDRQAGIQCRDRNLFTHLDIPVRKIPHQSLDMAKVIRGADEILISLI